MKKIDKNKFHTNGTRKTKALFREFAYEDYLEDAVYTLAREDVPPFHSLYKLYMKEGDPTEYQFVDKYLYDLKHWEALCKCSWFKPHITEWRKELNLKQHSELVSVLQEDALSNLSKTSTTSAKYLLDNYYRKNKSTKTGISKTTAEELEEANSKEIRKLFLEDAERIGIVERKVN